MKKILNIVALALLTVTGAYSQCHNGDFEECNDSQWEGATSNNINGFIDMANLAFGFQNNRHEVVNSGPDGPTGGAINQVAEGSCAFRLGNSSGGAQMDFAKYTFTVDNSNQDFSFRYAMVMNDPEGHTPAQKPFFGYAIVQGSNWPTAATLAANYVLGKKFVADKNNPFFTEHNHVVYRNWTTECANLSNYMGQEMSIIFVTSDCSFTAHYGYAYIDGLCKNNRVNAQFRLPNEICLSDPFMVDGSTSTNEDSHTWSIQEVNSSGNGVGPLYSQSYTAALAGIIDMKGFIQMKGGTIECNKRYKITLEVTGQCSPASQFSGIVRVSCPTISASAGPDRCTSGSNQLGFPVACVGCSYSWSPTTGLSNPNSPSPLVDFSQLNQTTTYTLIATDPEGCSSTDEVTVIVPNPPKLEINLLSCCGLYLTLKGGPFTSIVWSSGETNVTSIMPTVSGNHSVTVTDVCGTYTVNKSVGPPGVSLTRYHTNLQNPANYTFLSSGFVTGNTPLKIVNIEPTTPLYGEYYATDYRLDLWSRKEGNFRTIYGSIPNCAGFASDEIQWDGTLNGNNVQTGAYIGRLYMKNCATNGKYVPIKVSYCNKREENVVECRSDFLSFQCGFNKYNHLVRYGECTDLKKEYLFPITVTF